MEKETLCDQELFHEIMNMDSDEELIHFWDNVKNSLDKILVNLINLKKEYNIN